jgi:hypothetical protein
MGEIGLWVLLALVIGLLALSEVRPDVWWRWMHERLGTWLHWPRH